MKKQWRSSEARTLYRALTSSSRNFCSTSTTTATFPLKNVTKSNFESSLEDLRRHVRASDFVSIDLEMTGIRSAPWRDSLEYDRFDVHYLKVKDSAEKFAVVQFGVCPFRWDSSKQTFIAHPHNFYIFPRQELPVDGPSYEFLSQTSSLGFLAKYQFDFNLCIHEGISYLSRGQEEEALKRMVMPCRVDLSDSSKTLKEIRDLPVVSIADTLFRERMRNRFTEWRDDLLRERNTSVQLNGSSNRSKQQFETIFFKMRPALAMEGFTSHQLRLIQLVVKKHFNDLSYVHANCEDSNSRHLIVYTDSKGDKDLLMKDVKEGLSKEAEMKIKGAVGFRHVIDLLIAEQKLIVGHNCFLDIAHIYNKFLAPLPSTAEEFVSYIHKCFPKVIDTKILLNADNILQQLMRKNSTSLSKAFALMCPQIASNLKDSSLSMRPCVNVEVQVDDLRSSNWNSGAKHEAGYDAFMTGCVFAQACSHIGIDLNTHSSPSNFFENEKLQKYVNLLYLCWINSDIINLTTGKRNDQFLGSYGHKKRYPKVLFPNIVIIWKFPQNLKATEIKECIIKTFGPTSVTSVYHLDETAVFVQFSKTNLVHDFLALKDSLERGNGPISVLHPLSRLLEGGNTCAGDYEIYKEICGSSISKVLFADQAEAIGFQWKTKLVELKEVKSEEQVCSSEVSLLENIVSYASERSRRGNLLYS